MWRIFVMKHTHLENWWIQFLAIQELSRWYFFLFKSALLDFKKKLITELFKINKFLTNVATTNATFSLRQKIKTKSYLVLPGTGIKTLDQNVQLFSGINDATHDTLNGRSICIDFCQISHQTKEFCLRFYGRWC